MRWTKERIDSRNNKLKSWNQASSSLYKRKSPKPSRARLVRNALLVVLGITGFFLISYKRRPSEDKHVVENTQDSALHGPIAIYNDTILRTRLPEPYGVLQWNFLHANVLNVDNGSVIEILAFIPSDTSNRAQTFSTILDNVVTSSICLFPDGSSTEASRSNTADRPRALLYQCQIPPTYSNINPTSVELRMDLLDADAPFLQEIKLEKAAIPSLQAKLGICVSPLYGDIDMLRILEWRIHHARLGFESVHWYSREQTSRLHSWMAVWNKNLSVKDTWGHAPSLLDDQFKPTQHMHQEGAYADQVPYYMDCLARSKHTNPTVWLAFIDLDEFFMPSSLNASRTAISNFVDAHTNSSICIGRTDIRGPPLFEGDGYDTPPPLLNTLGSKLPTRRSQQEWNSKCLHRVEAVEQVFVHWPESYREGYRPQYTQYRQEQQGVPSILHARYDKIGGQPYNLPFDVTEKHGDWVDSLWHERDAVAGIINKQLSIT